MKTVLPSPCYVFSDAHLSATTPGAERTVLAFLAHVKRAARSLVIGGDLFDFWFEWRTVIPRPHFRVLAALSELVASGVEVLYVAGNHDCWGGDVLRRDVGVIYVQGPWEGELAGWRAHVDHGDGLRSREDRGYRMLRRVLRNRLAIAAFRLLHPDLAIRLASGSSSASRRHGAHDEGAGLRAIAMRRLVDASDIDLVVFAHSHVAGLEEAPGGGVYANAGGWMSSPTYLVLTPERIELRRWTGSAEGERLDAIDRRTQKSLAER